ncbi:MtfA peptidase [Methylophilaceae bacterium]|nr:MtfA peptidase [Methylophilaceae bacterium]
MRWLGFTDWRRRRILRRHALPDEAWRQAVAALPLLRGLTAAELGSLRELAALFLHAKDVVGAAGYRLDDGLRLKIAAQACLPVLALGLEYYDGWRSVIVYAGEFVPEHEFMDEAGVVHRMRTPMVGEAWHRGPVVLSAADVERSGEFDGVNVVIHEFAHKLDMRNGAADGFPPLHRGMSVAAWTRAFRAAYEDFCARADAGGETLIDPYASENPAEFFAVMSEAFFEIPQVLHAEYPNVYRQLEAFYRQDPLARIRPANDGGV